MTGETKGDGHMYKTVWFEEAPLKGNLTHGNDMCQNTFTLILSVDLHVKCFCYKIANRRIQTFYWWRSDVTFWYVGIGMLDLQCHD